MSTLFFKNFSNLGFLKKRQEETSEAKTIYRFCKHLGIVSDKSKNAHSAGIERKKTLGIFPGIHGPGHDRQPAVGSQEGTVHELVPGLLIGAETDEMTEPVPKQSGYVFGVVENIGSGNRHSIAQALATEGPESQRVETGDKHPVLKMEFTDKADDLCRKFPVDLSCFDLELDIIDEAVAEGGEQLAQKRDPATRELRALERTYIYSPQLIQRQGLYLNIQTGSPFEGEIMGNDNLAAFAEMDIKLNGIDIRILRTFAEREHGVLRVELAHSPMSEHQDFPPVSQVRKE